MKNKSTLIYFFFVFYFLSIISNSASAQNITVTGINSSCPNSASITVNVTGLASPVSYQLLQGSTIIRPFGGSGWTTTNIFADLPAGTYIVKARGNDDDNTIITSASVAVTENYTPITAYVNPASIIDCVGKPGSLSVTASGGSGNLSYGITPDNQNVAPASFQNSPVFSNLPPGSYKFWVKDNNCPTAIIMNTTGVYTHDLPRSATDFNAYPIYLELQNQNTATGGYKIIPARFFTGNYTEIPNDEKQFYRVSVKDVTTGITYAEQSLTSDYLFGANTVAGHTLEFTLRNICNNTTKTFPVIQIGPDVSAFATCGQAQAQYLIKDISLVSIPATIVFTNNNGTSSGNQSITVSNKSDVYRFVNLPPNSKFTWKVIDNDGKTWPGGVLDFTVDLTGGGSAASYLYSTANGCALDQSMIRIALPGIPNASAGLTYRVTASNNPTVPVSQVGNIVADPGNQGYLLELNGSNYWPHGDYTIVINSSGTCYNNASLNVSATGNQANITGVTKTAECGSFNFTINGKFSNPGNAGYTGDYELVILNGPGLTGGTTRAVTSITTTDPFTNMPYGTYSVALRIKGQTCNLIVLDPITFTAASSIDFDAINSGGFACGPGGTGDLTVAASTIINGAQLQYSINNGVTWQTSHIFHNIPIGPHSIRIRETGCGTETTQIVTVVETIEATINNNPIIETVCEGGNAVLNINAIGGTNYTWTYPDGTIHMGKVQNLNNVTAAMAGVYSVVVTTESCVTPAQKVSLNVLTKATVEAVAPQVACNNEIKKIPFTGVQSLKYSSPTTSVAVQTTYSWVNDNPAIGLAATGTGDISFTAVNTGAVAIVANITVTANTDAGCTGPSKTFAITINPGIGKPIITGANQFCTAVGTTLTSSASTGNQWYKDGNAISGATGQTYFASEAGSYTVAISGGSTCSSPSDPMVLTAVPCKITAEKTIASSPATVKSGDVLTYNITIKNSFGTAKAGVTASDDVPSTLVNINTISNGGVLTGNKIDWSGLTVPANGSITLSFKATVAANLPVGTTTIKNVAFVIDPTDPGNPITPEVEVPTDGKLTATKTIVGNPATVKAGDVLTYNITIKNSFGTAKAGVTASDDVPSTLVNINTISNGGVLTGNKIDWSGLTVPANGSITLSFKATVAANLPVGTTTIKNVASVIDPTDPGNPITPEVEVPTDGKLTATKTIVGNPATVKAGEELTYNITIKNSFGTAKAGVTASDDVPVSLIRVSSISNGGTLTGNQINWTGLTIPANGSITLSFKATVIADLTQASTIKNVAFVVDPTDTGNPLNPEVEVPTVQIAALILTKTALPGGRKFGDVINYSLVLTNIGNVTVTNIKITDANADQGSISPSTIVSLAPGVSVNITARHTITVADLERGYVSNLAKADGTDPNGNNVHAESKDPAPVPGSPVDPNCPDCTITPTPKDDFFIPNVITPNGDGKNDTFVIVGLEFFSNADVTIFNRWGNEVYRNSNYKNTWTGEGLNEGTYYYLLKMRKGEQVSAYKGWVLLKR
ncbi:T9SS type B sorting domain-containing protein [Pedobacter frigoris]|nr:gliding motility-associated C-terminal domain-containing protein [Pedobacter frigoris]